jgi:hypothetical protein
MHKPLFLSHLRSNVLLVRRSEPHPQQAGYFRDVFSVPQYLYRFQKVFPKAKFEELMGDEGTGNPSRLCFIQSTAGD